MTFKKNPEFTPHVSPAPAPTVSGRNLNKRSPPLNVRSTVSDPSVPDPTTTLPHRSNLSRNTPIPVAINTPIEPNEAFKNAAIPYLTAYMCNKTETVLLQLA